MATSSLHLTTLCLNYPSDIVAASCIDITCKWVKYEVIEIAESSSGFANGFFDFQLPESIGGQNWYEHINETITQEVLDQIHSEFMAVLEESPPKTKAKIEAIMNNRKTEVSWIDLKKLLQILS